MSPRPPLIPELFLRVMEGSSQFLHAEYTIDFGVPQDPGRRLGLPPECRSTCPCYIEELHCQSFFCISERASPTDVRDMQPDCLAGSLKLGF